MDPFSIRDGAWIIFTAGSVSPSVIVQIGLKNMKMRTITYAIAQEKQ
jgi:ABC-type phosphate transport system auxiliary subunit